MGLFLIYIGIGVHMQWCLVFFGGIRLEWIDGNMVDKIFSFKNAFYFSDK